MENERQKEIWVVHSKKEKYDVYIGRPSKYGNPFSIGKDGNRDEVIRKFESYLRQNPQLLLDAIKDLSGKTIACFCAPLACHGDIYKKYIESPELQAEVLKDMNHIEESVKTRDKIKNPAPKTFRFKF